MVAVSERGKITVEELRYLSIFQEFTGAMAYRCIVDKEGGRLIFLVDSADLGRAIGKKGSNVKLLSRLFNKNVEIVEYASDLEGMIKNLFPGVKILNIHVTSRGDEKMVTIKVAEEDKGKAIGRDGKNVKRARLVLSEIFGVSKVSIK